MHSEKWKKCKLSQQSDDNVKESKVIDAQVEMRKDPIFMYLNFLKWVINGEFESIQPKLQGKSI